MMLNSEIYKTFSSANILRFLRNNEISDLPF